MKLMVRLNMFNEERMIKDRTISYEEVKQIYKMECFEISLWDRYWEPIACKIFCKLFDWRRGDIYEEPEVRLHLKNSNYYSLYLKYHGLDMFSIRWKKDRYKQYTRQIPFVEVFEGYSSDLKKDLIYNIDLFNRE